MKKLLLILTCLLAFLGVTAVVGTRFGSTVSAIMGEDNLQRLQRELKGKSHCRLMYTTFDKRYALVAVGVMTDKNPARNPWDNKRPVKLETPFVALYSVNLETYEPMLLGIVEDNTEYEEFQDKQFNIFHCLSKDGLELSADGYAFNIHYSLSATYARSVLGRVDTPNYLVHSDGHYTPELSRSGKTYTNEDFDSLAFGNDDYIYYPTYEYDFSGNKLGCTYTLCDNPGLPWFGSDLDLTLSEELFRGKREEIEAHILSSYVRLSDVHTLSPSGKYSRHYRRKPKKFIVHLERIEDKGEQGLYLYADGGRVLIKKPELSQWPLDLKACLAQNPKGIDILIGSEYEHMTDDEDGTLVIESAQVLYVTGAKDSYREYYKEFYKSLE